MPPSDRSIELVRKLGAGGFGEVYLATLHGRDRFVRQVAVKLLKPDQQKEAQARRHRDEARLLGMLSHDHIVQVLDLAELDGKPAVVMEYVQGVDLGAVLEAEGKMPLKAVLEVGRAVASALDCAWNAPSPIDQRPLRVIHRDIKPPNLLLTAAGGVKVLDFGIARGNFDRDIETQSGLWGTPRFMAPELVLENSPPTPAIDTWALGLCLLDLLHGPGSSRPPFLEHSLQQYLSHHLADLPPPVQELFRQIFSLDPTLRPSHQLLHQRLNALLRDLPGDGLYQFSSRVIPPLLSRAEPSQTFESATLRPTRRRWSPATIFFVALLVALMAGLVGRWSAQTTTESPPELDVATVIPQDPVKMEQSGGSPATEAATAVVKVEDPEKLRATLQAENTDTAQKKEAKKRPATQEEKEKTGALQAGTGGEAARTEAPVATPIAVQMHINAGGWRLLVDGKATPPGTTFLPPGLHRWSFQPPALPGYENYAAFDCDYTVIGPLALYANINTQLCAFKAISP